MKKARYYNSSPIIKYKNFSTIEFQKKFIQVKSKMYTLKFSSENNE